MRMRVNSKIPRFIIPFCLSLILRYADCDCEGFRSYKVVMGGGNWDQEMSVSVSTWDVTIPTAPVSTLKYMVYGAAYPNAPGVAVSPRTISLAEGETYRLVPADSYGDGWNGGSLQMYYMTDVTGVPVRVTSISSLTQGSGGTADARIITVGITECSVPCPPGETGPDEDCQECAAGTWKSSPGSEPCDTCLAYSSSPVGSIIQTACTCNAARASIR